MTMFKFLGILALMQFCLLSQAFTLILDEALLISSQGFGHVLYLNCVLAPPVTQEQLVYCASLKLSYIAGLHTLNQPLLLNIASLPDPYTPNPFSPCTYEIAYLIIPDICPGG